VYKLNTELIKELKEIEYWFLINQVDDKAIYIVGILIFLGFLVVLLTKRVRVPIVVGYVFLGILLSVNIIEWLPFLSPEQKEWYIFTLDSFEYITDIALAFIAFTIGSELSVRVLKKLGKTIAYVVILESAGAFLLVTLAVLALGRPLYLALLLGAIASATAPAATVMVLKEYRAEGMLTSMILAVVGIDDAIALIIFSLIEPIALIQYAGVGQIAFPHILLEPLLEITGSLIVGLFIGYLSQRFMTGFEDKTRKILTLVSTIIGGTALAILFDLSPLITNMAIGFAYRNFARKNLGIGEYIDTLTTPLYALFFILAGTEIRFDSIVSFTFLSLAFVYLVARMIGKISGSFLGAYLSNAPDIIKKYIGFGLLPQSGVAIALAYTVQKDFADAAGVGLLVFNTLLFTAALTEVIGPFATKYVIFKAGEAQEIES
jgi:Kef-type K+ transport system membrane component KefB